MSIQDGHGTVQPASRVRSIQGLGKLDKAHFWVCRALTLTPGPWRSRLRDRSLWSWADQSSIPISTPVLILPPFPPALLRQLQGGSGGASALSWISVKLGTLRQEAAGPSILPAHSHLLTELRVITQWAITQPHLLLPLDFI